MPRVGPTGELPSALKVLARKTSRATSHWTDLWRYEHANAFVIAGITELDVLDEVLTSLRSAAKDGIPYPTWIKSPAAKRTGLPPHRLRVVFDTNIRMARAEEQWQRIEKQRKALPFLRYHIGPAKEHRPHHVVLDGMILPVDHPFWRYGMPPNGHLCHCGVTALTKSASARIRATNPGPDFDKLPKTKEWPDPRPGHKGQKLILPYGPDPGFDFNPGIPESRIKKMTDLIEDKTKTANKVKATKGLNAGVVEAKKEAKKAKVAIKTTKPKPVPVPVPVVKTEIELVRGYDALDDKRKAMLRSYEAPLSVDEFKTRLTRALNDSDLSEVRNTIRHMARQVLGPGSRSCDLFNNSDYDKVSIVPNGFAYHGWQGEIILNSELVDFIAGKNLRVSDLSLFNSTIKILIHEEMHGHTGLVRSNYTTGPDGVNRVFEELYAESLARRVWAGTLGGSTYSYGGAYNTIFESAARVYRQVTGSQESDTQVFKRFGEAATVLAKGDPVRGYEDRLRLFTDALVGSGSQAEQLRARLPSALAGSKEGQTLIKR